jgi:hypothetical protein
MNCELEDFGRDQYGLLNDHHFKARKNLTYTRHDIVIEKM